MKKSKIMNDPYTNDPEYQATDLESKYPPPFFPPHAKTRFHPYNAKPRSTQQSDQRLAKPVEAFKQLKFRTDKQIPHSQTIGWMPQSEFKEMEQGDLCLTLGKASYPNYNEFSMEELAEKLNVQRVF